MSDISRLIYCDEGEAGEILTVGVFLPEKVNQMLQNLWLEIPRFSPLFCKLIVSILICSVSISRLISSICGFALFKLLIDDLMSSFFCINWISNSVSARKLNNVLILFRSANCPCIYYLWFWYKSKPISLSKGKPNGLSSILVAKSLWPHILSIGPVSGCFLSRVYFISKLTYAQHHLTPQLLIDPHHWQKWSTQISCHSFHLSGGILYM